MLYHFGETRPVKAAIDLTLYKEFRKILFMHSISVQSFFAKIVELLVKGDNNLHNILIQIKKDIKIEENNRIVKTDTNSIYNLIEEDSPFSKG